MTEYKNRLIIGIGNPLRGDDSFGVETVEFLKEEYPDLACFLIEKGDLTRIIDRWVDKDVVIIDAIQTANGKIGDIHCVSDFSKLETTYDNNYSSHSLSLAEVYELGQQLNRLPRSTYFIGVKGANWGVGKTMSEGMRAVMDSVGYEVLRYFSVGQ